MAGGGVGGGGDSLRGLGSGGYCVAMSLLYDISPIKLLAEELDTPATDNAVEEAA